MFQLTEEEKTNLVAFCDHLNNLKYSPQLPYVFTEHLETLGLASASGEKMKKTYRPSSNGSALAKCAPKPYAPLYRIRTPSLNPLDN